MILEVDPYNPTYHQIKEVSEVLENGGLVVLPTDTVYTICCSLENKKGLKKLCDIKEGKHHFSILLNDLSNISTYTGNFDRSVFKLLNRYLPGPYTFILPASQKIAKAFGTKKKTVGIRIPNNDIVRQIIEYLGHPLACTSVNDEDEILEYTSDPNEIAANMEDVVELIVDGGYGSNDPTTVVDCTVSPVEIIREGAGEKIVL